MSTLTPTQALAQLRAAAADAAPYCVNLPTIDRVLAQVAPEAAPLADAELQVLATLDFNGLAAAAKICRDFRDSSQRLIKADPRDWAKHLTNAETLADALPGLLARVAAAEAGVGQALMPADIQPAILLAQANIALRDTVDALDTLLKVARPKLDGDQLEGVYAAYHKAGALADTLRPIVEAANKEAQARMAANAGEEPAAC